MAVRLSFTNFYRSQKGSCAELRSQLYVAYDAEYLSIRLFNELMNAATETGNVIGGLRVSVERRKALT